MKQAYIASIMALSVALAACGGKDEPANETPPAAVIHPDAPDTPVSIESHAPATPFEAEVKREESSYSASASFPPDLDRIAPVLAQELSDAAHSLINSTAEGAAFSAIGDEAFFRPYEVEIEWSYSAQTSRLISVTGIEYIDAGGAHPNVILGGVIHDIKTAKTLSAAKLFADPEAAAKLIIGPLRASLLAEKMERYGKNAVAAEIEAELDEILPADSILLGEVALVTSTEGGKIGGLKVLFSPYDIGPYVEGSYEAVVPQSVFASALKPEYADLFSGEPLVEDAD